MIKPYECTQCGSTRFEDLPNSRVVCSFCGSMFKVLTNEPKVVICEGAKVVFGKNANVHIKGSMEIQNGANVDIQGNVTIQKDGKPAKFQLELIKRGKNTSNAQD